MTKIAELKDKGAVVAWSPIGGGEYADVIALGSKVRVAINFFRIFCKEGGSTLHLFSLLMLFVGWKELQTVCFKC